MTHHHAPPLWDYMQYANSIMAGVSDWNDHAFTANLRISGKWQALAGGT
jgi:hypothetical protein